MGELCGKADAARRTAMVTRVRERQRDQKPAISLIHSTVALTIHGRSGDDFNQFACLSSARALSPFGHRRLR
jgi:hypothetical protein